MLPYAGTPGSGMESTTSMTGSIGRESRRALLLRHGEQTAASKKNALGVGRGRSNAGNRVGGPFNRPQSTGRRATLGEKPRGRKRRAKVA